MEFSKEVLSVFRSVMSVQGKSAIKIGFENVDGGKKLCYDVCDIKPNDRHIVVDGIDVIINEESENMLKNVRFIILDGGIGLECIVDCDGCSHKCEVRKNV